MNVSCTRKRFRFALLATALAHLVVLTGAFPAPASAAVLTWNTTTGNWDTSTANWTGGSSTFTNGSVDSVTFSGTGGGTVTVSANMSPSAWIVSATSGTYTFTGGPVSGTGSLAKSNAGILVLSSSNGYSGGTTISGAGRILVNASGSLGSGAVAITPGAGGNNSTADGALLLANGVTLANDVVIGNGASVTIINAASGGSATFAGNFSGGLSGQNLRITTGHGGVTFTGTSSFVGGYGLQVNSSVTFANSANFGVANVGLQAPLTVRNNAALTVTGSIGDSTATTAVFTISDSASVSVASVYLTRSNASNPQTLNLDGGTLTTGFVQTASSLAATINLNGGVLKASGDQANFLQGIKYVARVGRARIDTNGFAVGVAASISGTGGLTKLGAGTLTLSATQGYSGSTIISEGTLAVGPTGAINSSSGITLSGGSLNYNSGFALTKGVTFSGAGGTLSGTGTIGTGVTVGSNAILAPGNSPGSQSFTSGLTLDQGGAYVWEINDWAGSAGFNYDQLAVSGSALNVAAVSGSTFKIAVTGLTSGNVSGVVPNFSGSAGTSFTIATSAAGITGFDKADFTVDSSNFTNSNPLPTNAGFWVSQSGNNLVLNYAPSATYDLSAAASVPLIHVGGSSTITATVTSSTASLTNPDSLSYGGLAFLGLGGLSSTSGTLSGGESGSGSVVFTGTAAGAFTFSPSMTSATNVNIGTNANAGSNVGVTVNVFSGNGIWSGTGGGSWGSGASANWTSAEGVAAAPGTFAGYANTDSATFGGTVSSGTSTIVLDGAQVSLAALAFSNTAARYVIATGTGSGSLTLAKASSKPTVDVLGTHEIVAPILGTSGLQKTGAGKLILSGSSSYSGGTEVAAGTLAVNGAIAGNVAVDAGATVGGSGAITGVLSGAGVVGPGNSPGILTATQFNPAGGLGAAFEFTASAPVYGAPSASLNDVLRLTDSTTPFLSALSSGNVINVYFDVPSIKSGDTFEGGFFTALSAGSLLTAIKDASFSYWVRDDANGTPFNGVNYSPLTGVAGITGASVTTIARTANFGGVDTVNGSVTQFVIIPEPDTVIVAGIGIVMAGWSLWKRRRHAP